MKRFFCCSTVAVVFTATLVHAQEPASIPIERVALFSSGVGYFEHGGSLEGDAEVELQFKTAQINDILKSLVVQDLDGGTVAVVDYPSRDPLSKLLRGFEIDLSGNPSLPDLLNQLRGARVTVLVQAEKITGTILGIDRQKKWLPDQKETIEIFLLNVVTVGGIRAVQLDDVRSIQLDDAELQQELERALNAVAEARDQDEKKVKIRFQGEGSRRVRIGYVIEAPVWKTSYRLVLAPEPEQAYLQGWAIVENQTDSDWHNVELRLVSGRPISFIQQLYEPFYLPRQEVTPERFLGLKPPLHEGYLRYEEAETAADEAKDFARRGEVAFQAPGAAAPAEQPALEIKDSVAAIAQTAQLGHLFHYAVSDVSLERQRSAMVPVITGNVTAEKLSIYNRQTLAKHPLHGARLRNTTGKHLQEGPITVFDEQSYAGDARIDDVPPEQERYLSYGVDLDMLVNPEKEKQESAIMRASIVKGVLRLQRKLSLSQPYLIDNKSDNEKTLIIEHAFRKEWKLEQPEKALETTEELYRFETKIPPKKSSTFNVVEARVLDETLGILPADFGVLDLYSRSGEIPKEVRAALAKALEFRRAMVTTERQIEQRRARIAETTQEQERIRENLRTVPQKTDYYTRLLKKLNDQETALEKLQSEIDSLEKKLREQRNQLEEYLSGLNVG